MKLYLILIYLILVASVICGQQAEIIKWHEKAVIQSQFSPDGKVMASLGADKIIRIWKTDKFESFRSLDDGKDGDVSIDFSPDGKYLVSGNWDNIVKIWDVASGKVIRRLTGHEMSLRAVRYHPGGNFIASGGWDKDIRIWYAPTGMTLKILKGHSQCVRALCYSPDGRFLASGGNDLVLKIWNVSKGEEVWSLKGNIFPIECIDYNPDGSLIATGSYGNNIILWDVKEGKIFKVLKGHDGAVYSVKFSPDGKYLASGSNDNTAKIWSIASQECIMTLTGHTVAVKSVAFSPDGKQLVSSSTDRSFRVWNIESLNIEPSKRASENNIIAEKGKKITWTDPSQLHIEMYERIVTVKAEVANDLKSGRFKLFLNKAEYTEFDGTDKSSPFPAVTKISESTSELAYKVYLKEGENELLLFNESEDGSAFCFSNPLIINYSDLSERRTGSTLHVLLINTLNYEDKKLNKTYVPDKTDKLTTILMTQEGKLFGKVNIRHMENASGPQIMGQLDSLSKVLKSGDQLFIFVSGFILAGNTGEFYYLPSSVSMKDIPAAAVLFKDIAVKTEFIDAQTSLFIDITNQPEKEPDDFRFPDPVEFMHNLTANIRYKKDYAIMLIKTGDIGFAFDNIANSFHQENDINNNQAIDMMEINQFMDQLNKTTFILKGRNTPVFINKDFE